MRNYKIAKREMVAALNRNIDYHRSKKIDVHPDNVQTVCLFLGPYRNLTTFTASIIYLHPSSQVLNHAGDSVLSFKPVNFLKDYSDKKFDNFVKYAIYLSQCEQGLRQGGSITFSHAFTEFEAMRDTYKKRYGNQLLKTNIQSVTWKESMRVSNFVKRNQIDLLELCAKNSRLRFLMPIRNPLECALSNRRRPEGKLLVADSKFSLEAILESILRQVAWIMELYDANPDQFFFYYESELDHKILSSLANFLDLELDEAWIQDSLSTYEPKPRSIYDRTLLDHYFSLLQTLFEKHPEAKEKLAKFAVSD
jgi:hypothetical protein